MTVAEARRSGQTLLSNHPEQTKSSSADAALLLMHVLGYTRAELLAYPERILSSKEEQVFLGFLHERASGKPVQYIIGEQEFWGLPFAVTPDVLIPRPETEHLIEAALERLQDFAAPRIVDVGTGSGAIAVALSHALRNMQPRTQVTAVDICEAALTVARQNAARNGVGEKIRWLQSDLLTAVLAESFDVVLSNPPYIAEEERAALATEVREHEPALALFSGPTGLEVYARLIPQAARVLTPAGWLILEIGCTQQPAIARLLQGWESVEFLPDLQGHPRVACAQRPVKK